MDEEKKEISEEINPLSRRSNGCVSESSSLPNGKQS